MTENIFFAIIWKMKTLAEYRKLAHGCVSRADFKRKHAGAYKDCCTLGYMDKLGLPSTKEARSAARTIYSNTHIETVARKYMTLRDFRISEPNLYGLACKRGLIHGFTWLVRCESLDDGYVYDTIYAYEFKDTHVVYVGRSVRPSERHRDHCADGDPVYEYCRNRGIAMPEPTILHTGVNVAEGAEYERSAMLYYRDRGWTMLNRIAGGSMGGLGCTRLSKKYCMEVARGFSEINEMLKEYPSIVRKLYKRGWMDECTWLCKTRPVGNRYRTATDSELAGIASQYRSSTEFIRGNCQAYYEARARGLDTKPFYRV